MKGPTTMRVLHVISSFGVGGAENMLLKLVRSLAPRGLTFRVVSMTSDGPIGEQLRQAGAETTCLGMTRGIPNPMAVGALLRVARRFRPDVIQSWMYHADLLAGLVGRMAGVPVIWGIRSSGLEQVPVKRATRLVRRACAMLSSSLPQVIVSCSRAAAEEHVAMGYRASRVRVIPNGFELGRFRPSPEARLEVRRELELGADQRLIGLVARYHPIKDHANFVRAVAAFTRLGGEAVFLACGDDVTPDNRALARLLEEGGVQDRVRLLGRRSDMPRITAALDLATLSSLGEGFPNVIGEAMACEVPAVVTDVGDSSWLVGDTGRAVPPGNPEALAAAWAAMLALAPEARAELGRRARQRVEEEFEIGRTARRFEALYREVLGAAPAVS